MLWFRLAVFIAGNVLAAVPSSFAPTLAIRAAGLDLGSAGGLALELDRAKLQTVIVTTHNPPIGLFVTCRQ